MNESETKFFESGGQDVATELLESTPAATPPEEQATQETASAPVEPASAAPERDSREGRFVPLQALQEERAEKKQLREELRQYREWQSQLAHRLQQMPASQPSQAPMAPDPRTRPLDYINHVLGNVQRNTTELQQWRAQQEATAQQQTAVQQALDWAEEQGRDYVQTQPEYHEAYRFAEETRDKELKALGYGPGERAAIVKANRMEIINNALQLGKNPAELIWEYARARGFLSKGSRKDASAEAQAQAKIAAGLQAAGGKLNRGGATGEGEMSAKGLSGIGDPDEFERAWKKVFGRRR
jgi:hypothetical protein